MKASLRATSFVVFSLCPAFTACGGSGSEPKNADDVKCPPGQSYDGEFCQVDQTVATAETPTGSEPEETPLQPKEPVEEAPPVAEENPAPEVVPPKEPETPARTPATPVDVSMAAQAGPIIQYLASSHLPSGARQMGAPFAGQFATGQEFEQKVQLTGGKCYTVVAAGLPPVAEVNLELYVEGEKEPALKDETVGVQAVIGSRASCFKPESTGPYRLVLWVEKGQGVAAAQVFQK